jgi:pilus assembly protein CpaB
MKGTKAGVMLLLSLLSGVVAVGLAARWLSQQAEPVMQQVVVVTRDVAMGEALTLEMLESVPWNSSVLPRGAFRALDGLEGRVVLSALAQGEPVLASRLAPVGAKAGLSAVIPGGRRAITVKVNEVVGVAGFALPGNHVDVMVNMQDAQREPVSKIVLERILVLAVAQEASRDESRPKVVNAVTLEVSPEQAERLDLARSVGTLSLVLRNQVDQAATATTGIRRADLLGDKALVVAPRAAAPQRVTAPPRPVSTQRARSSSGAAPTDAVPNPNRPSIEVIRGVQRSSASL